MAPPRATYRLQFHAGFTFADAIAQLDYLRDLGISHVYASPITVARAGSTHFYDVADPTRVSDELGGEAGLDALVLALRARGMGLIIDIVPNHMGVGADNRWWSDVLAHGRASRYAAFFDIDWARGDGKLLLPVLGASLEETLQSGDIAVATDPATGETHLTLYGDAKYPLRPDSLPPPGEPAIGTDRDALRRLLDQQHYRLDWWRVAHDTLNWRRFFSITDLAGLRVEDPAVFEATHALYFRLYSEGKIDGVRIDHVDGLADPSGYLSALRERLDSLADRRPEPFTGQTAWIVVEKILGPGEDLPDVWPIDGTSGYDFMETVNAALHNPDAESLLGDAWTQISGRSPRFAPEEVLARDQMLSWEFSAQREQAIAAFFALAQTDRLAGRFTSPMIGRAIDALLMVFPVYRTYGTGSSALAGDAAIRATARSRVTPHVAPGEFEVVDWILGCLAGESAGNAAEAVQRFQQLSAPIAAKAVEDTAFYRYGRLLSRNDVGADVAHFALSADAFHARIARQAARFPHAMLATATHDHKRGEDVRARIAALSHAPDAWLDTFARFAIDAGHRVAEIDRGDLYMLAQMVFGVWPEHADPTALSPLADRLKGWQEKAVREAKLRSSWVAPDEAYEGRLFAVVDWIVGGADAGAARQAFTDLLAVVGPHAQRLSLAQIVLKLTVPGVPDTYQGTEGGDWSLVDPDNRRPVDYPALREALGAAETSEKLETVRTLLALRRERPALFAEGRYTPVPAGSGTIAFVREHEADRLFVSVDITGGGVATATQTQTEGDAILPNLERHGIHIRLANPTR